MKKCTALFWVVLLLPWVSGSTIAQEPQPGAPLPGSSSVDDQIKKLRDQAVLNPALAEPEFLVDIYRDNLRHWPRHKPGKEAVRQLIRGGKGVCPYLYPLLDSRDYRLKPAVAHILGSLGYTEAADKVEALLDDPNLKGSVRNILQSLFGLAPDRAIELSLVLMAHGEKAYRQAAFAILEDHVEASNSPMLHEALANPLGEVRCNAFALLEKLADPGLDAAALALVGDVYPRLAHAVTRYLGYRNVPEVVEGLEAMLTFEPSRKFAFALATLVQIENTSNAAILDPALIPRIEPFLDNRDPLFKVSAAAALSNLCTRNENETDSNLIHNRVVPTLMEVFLKHRYFKDFACMLDLAAESMRKSTGAPFDTNLVYWRDWWEKEGQNFVDHQFLITVDASQVSGLVINCKNLPCGDKIKAFTVAGHGCLLDPGFKKLRYTLFISDKDMERLVELLYVRGYFERAPDYPVMGPAAEEGGGGPPSIEMVLDTRSRNISGLDPDDAGFQSMVEAMSRTYEENFWQVLYPGGDLRKWWDNRYDWWQEEADEPERTERFFLDLLEAFGALPDVMILECCAWLEKREDLAAILTEQNVKTLLSKLEKRWRVDDLVMGVARLIMAVGEPGLFEPMVTYLYGSYMEASYPVLLDAMVAFDQVDKSIADSRWFMRVVAARAIVRTKGDRFNRLYPLLEDERKEVRLAALESLAALPGDQGHAYMETVMASEDRDAKAVLLRTLSGRTDGWVLGFYEGVLTGLDPAMWSVALEWLPPFHSTRAASLIGDFILAHDFDTEPAEEAIVALKAMGGKEARDTALALMELCPDEERVRRVIFALADLGDTRIFPRLADCMLVESLRERALDAMAFLVVADFGEENWKYRELWEKFPQEDQAYFLRHALDLTAVDPSREECWEGIPRTDLVQALRSKEWPVRSAALRILEEGSGRSFGALERNSDEAVIKEVADAWQFWLENEEKPPL